MTLASLIGVCAAFFWPAFAAAQQAQRPLILAHYMPWFSAPPQRPHWGWHWTMGAFDPEQVEQGRRRIASHYYPLIGPYDSGDAAVIEYHLLLMKVAGMDGLVVDWYGLADHYDYAQLHQNAAALFPPAAAFGLRVGVCYEDRTIGQLEKAGKLGAGERVEHARHTLEWLRQHWFAEPAYLRLGGRPVLLSFGHEGLTEGEWEQVLSAASDSLLYLSEHRRRSAADGAFDWPVPGEGLASLERFYASAGTWPVALPVVFPRFRDIYAEAGVHASYGQIADAGGHTFTTSLRRALESGAPLVQIATWNDWGEGTMVEPSLEFGFRDLEAVQRLRRETIDPGFPFRAEDLRLVHRLYELRRGGMHSQQREKLDQIARLLAAGQVVAARRAVDRVESTR